ncbi:MAG: DUF1778 domain-containing protein [Hyphomicrobiales bacterium]|nr:DUF1778 domain-containing protein [Hyphomicrobiales bacterium]
MSLATYEPYPAACHRPSGQRRTHFMLEAARRAAEEALLDQSLLRVGPEAYDAFLTGLDAPPQPNGQLRKTMQTPPPREDA